MEENENKFENGIDGRMPDDHKPEFSEAENEKADYENSEDGVENYEEYDEVRESNGAVRKGIAMPLVVVLMIGSGLLGALSISFIVPYFYGNTPRDVYGNAQTTSGLASENFGMAGEEKTGNTVAGNINSDAQITKINDNGVLNPVAAVAKKLQPSIVNIKTKQAKTFMFHNALMSGMGSGVIYSRDGYILTNDHVVEGSSEIIVTIGIEEVKAKLIATDQETDLAILKIDKTGLQPAEFGSTKDIQVGDLAVAIGSPFGLEHTVTSGIISAKNRTVSVPNERTGRYMTYVNLIQTDASINPGNSGGALSDANGRVIGINSIIASSSGTSDGVGFAIPSELAKRVADQLIKGGKVSHTFIGISGHDVSDVFAGGAKPSIKYGAQIVDVISGSPADKAGLKQQDVIVAIGGEQVNNMNDLVAAIRMKQVGEKVKLIVIRNDKKMTVELVLAEKPKETTS